MYASLWAIINQPKGTTMDKVSSDAVDDETRGLVEKGYKPPKSKPPAYGDKLIGQLEREATARRTGGGTGR
jgi:hypothetical protein